ncbi:hypothetical protein [Actinokineospora diospyrosa]|uniref:Ig-like domain-containing protein n=1 Tax=Actinokineospora diospyrosa TaxID=103728 RepID=A0ABT1I7D5_9PSEU|nr:hypothetical protein [Actinokineospora diospyrosa]MCP2268532.1 hypothetical protein [Actinokineospora diospyrosa]
MKALGGLVLGAAVAFGAVGCTTVQAADAANQPTLGTTTSAQATGSAASTPESEASSATRKVPTTGKATTTTTTTHRVTTTTSRPVTNAAKIVSFTVVSKPACPVLAKPGAPFSSPGAPVVIAWKITGAEGAAISVDSPGMYGSYGSDYAASGQLELSFPCETTPGKTTHTYTVWPKGLKTVSQSLTVSATNNT